MIAQGKIFFVTRIFQNKSIFWVSWTTDGLISNYLLEDKYFIELNTSKNYQNWSNLKYKNSQYQENKGKIST